MRRAVTPTARARRAEEAPSLSVGEEGEREEEEEVEGGDDDEDEEEASSTSIRSRRVTSHQGPTVLIIRSMPRSAASRCTSAKVSKGAAAPGEEEGEEGEAEEPTPIADLLRRLGKLG